MHFTSFNLNLLYLAKTFCLAMNDSQQMLVAVASIAPVVAFAVLQQSFGCAVCTLDMGGK